MLKINDTRDTCEKRLRDIELGGFFEFDDVLCRRVCWNDTEIKMTNRDGDDLVVMQMYSGELTTLNRDTFVIPISDKQIWLEVGD